MTPASTFRANAARLPIAGLVSCSLLATCLAATFPARAADIDMVSIAVRGHFWDERVLGKEQPQEFDQYDLVATARLPWEGFSWGSWHLGARLLGSAGALRSGPDSALVVSAIPALAIVQRDIRLAIEAGAGLAFLGRHDFPAQDYGGPVQFALTFGVSAPIYKGVGIGYRFMHYSDAGAYGQHTIGADFHMIELAYHFR